MKKIILKILSLIAAFLLGIVFMSYYQAAGNNDSTDEMADATLPLIYMVQDGQNLNLMHGYTQAMDAGYMRDAVLPIPEDRCLTLRIECPDAEVENIFYEIRSLDTTRLVEDTEVTEYTREDELILADFELKDLLDAGEEYLLVIRLELERGQEAFYYTHLLNKADTRLEECMDFVNQIHTALFDKENTVSIAQYMETDSSADNDTLAHVTIHSKYRQMIWADMEVQVSSQVRTYITELEESIASVRLEYEVAHENESGETEQYHVQESYRVRHTKQRMYLLDYDRIVNRIFDPDLNIFSEKAVQLGILNEEVEYRKNAEENIVGFVQNGELWCYDVAQNKLSYVFGFRDGDDLRSSYQEHAIKIVDIDESGSMHFLVYGYMNRGRHEGRTGVAVYTYDAMTNSVEERIFMESTKPFQILENEIGTLAYVNEQEELYLYVNETICKINLQTREYEAIVSGIAEENSMICDAGHILAWHKENSQYETETIEMMDLETGGKRSIAAREGFYLQALGFMGTDFIYGEARKDDIQKDITGNHIFPMGFVVIQDEQGVVIREFNYEEKGKYVTSISIESNRILLSCVAKTEDGGYAEAMPEPITNKTVEEEAQIALETKNSAFKKREYYFSLANGPAESQIKFLAPRQVLFEGNRTVQPEVAEEDPNYYVYAFNGKYVGAYKTANAAVLEAYNHMGVVVDADQDYIWRRGDRKTRAQLSGFENPQEKEGESSLQSAVEILLGMQNTYADAGQYLADGYTPHEILDMHLKGRVLDLSGCSVNMVQYYISQGYPVLALEGGQEAELIIGYDPQNIVLLDPITGKTYKMGINDSTQMFAELGNLFVVCIQDEEA